MYDNGNAIYRWCARACLNRQPVSPVMHNRKINTSQSRRISSHTKTQRDGSHSHTTFISFRIFEHGESRFIAVLIGRLHIINFLSIERTASERPRPIEESHLMDEHFGPFDSGADGWMAVGKKMNAYASTESLMDTKKSVFTQTR